MRRLGKPAIVCFIILVCTLWIYGCWDRRELNTLGIVTAVAIDMEDRFIKMTFEVIKPSRGKMGSESEDEVSVYVESTGKSIYEAVRKASASFDRILFFPHCSEYIFSEEIARKGLVDFLDFWSRDQENRRRTYILIAKDCRAVDVMGSKGGIEREFAHYMKHLVENVRVDARSVMIDLREFMIQYYADGMEPVAVRVMAKRRKEKIGDEKPEYFSSSEGAAIFKKEKLVGFIDGDEVICYNIIRNNLKSAVVSVASPNSKGMLSIEFNATKAKSKVEIVNGRARITVNIKIWATLGEAIGMLNLKENSEIEKIEKMLAKKISKQSYSLIDKSRYIYKSDFLGFGNILYQSNYKQWKKIKDKWEDVFANSEIIVKVDPEIERRGYVNIPVGIEEMK